MLPEIEQGSTEDLFLSVTLLVEIQGPTLIRLAHMGTDCQKNKNIIKSRPLTININVGSICFSM